MDIEELVKNYGLCINHPGERRGLHTAARVKINFRHKFVRRSIVISFTNLFKIYESVDRVP